MSAIPDTHPPLHRDTREHRAWTPKYNKWVIAFGITIATFMEGARHQCRQCRAAPHRGRTRRQSQRKHLGANLVHGLQRRGPADERLVFDSDRTQALLHGQRRTVHDEFGAVRFRAESDTVDSVPDTPGRWWRRARSQRTRNFSGYLHRRRTPHRVCNLRDRGDSGAGDWTDCRRWVTDHYSWRWIFSSTCRQVSSRCS